MNTQDNTKQLESAAIENTAIDCKLSLKSQIEAIIFASPQPVSVKDIISTLDNPSITKKTIEHTLAILEKDYLENERGFYLEIINRSAYQLRTKPEVEHLIAKLFSSRPKPLSRAAQETLAIIAYRQPVTRADIEFIRGVDAGSIIKNLIERDFITCIGRKEELGRPMLFGTTDEFLRVFKLKSIKDLAPLESFQPSREIVENAIEKIASHDNENTIKDIQDSLDQGSS